MIIRRQHFCSFFVLPLMVGLLVSCTNSDSRQEKLASSSDWAVGRHETPAISVDDAKKIYSQSNKELSSRPLFVDTRAVEEYKVSHIPGAVVWPRDGSAPPAEVVDAINAERPVILYCSIGERSGAAGDELLAAYKVESPKVYNLQGGLFLWAEEVGSLEGGELVHPYDDEWGQLLAPHLRAPLDD